MNGKPAAKGALPTRAANRLAFLAVELAAEMEKVAEERRPVDVALSQHFRTHPELGSRDRRFLSDLVFSYFRWRGWTRHAPKPDLRKACVISCLLDSTTVHAAVRVLAKDSGIPAQELKPLAALSLSKKAAAASRLYGEKKPLPLSGLFPKWMENALALPGGKGAGKHFLRCLEALQQRPPTWLRVAAGQHEAVLAELKQAGIEVLDRHARLTGALAVAGSSPLRALVAGARSRFEVQDLASQCVGIVCAARSGEEWWDVCAGAGGKSLHIADMMQNRGFVLATDPRPSALAELRRRARRTGATIIHTRPMEYAERRSGHLFDGVLVDAPCSGIGTWSRNPDARWRTNEADVRDRAATQLDILSRAAGKVRAGGALVYSVCTLTKAETNSIVEAFLERRRDFAPEPFVHPLTGEKTEGLLWIWPWAGPCDGMFIARMKRTSALLAG